MIETGWQQVSGQFRARTKIPGISGGGALSERRSVGRTMTAEAAACPGLGQCFAGSYSLFLSWSPELWLGMVLCYVDW